MNRSAITSIVKRHEADHGGLISILEEVQAKNGYLPASVLEIVAESTGRSLVDVFGVATFYKSFSMEPRGKHLCSVCVGTACHVRGAPVISESFERELEVEDGGTTADKEFTLETVACLGACALGPIVVVDGHYFSNVKTGNIKKIIKRVRKGLDDMGPEEARTAIPLEVSCPRCNHSLMDRVNSIDGKASIRLTISFERKHGWLRLSSLYGSYTVESEYELSPDIIVHFFCPHCHAEMRGGSECADCGATMVPMIVRGGGVVQICSRHGCRNHMLDVNGVNL